MDTAFSNAHFLGGPKGSKNMGFVPQEEEISLSHLGLQKA